METKPFEVGKTYQRRDGMTVTCVQLRQTADGIEFGAKFDDLGEQSWRYNTPNERGQLTGCGPLDNRTVIPEPAGSPTDFEEAVKLLEEIYEHGETITRHTKIGEFLSRIGK